jgi:hypothetical protein
MAMELSSCDAPILNSSFSLQKAHAWPNDHVILFNAMQ